MKTAIRSFTILCCSSPIPTMFFYIFWKLNVSVELPTHQYPFRIWCFNKFYLVFVEIIFYIKFYPAHSYIYLYFGGRPYLLRTTVLGPFLLTKSKEKETKRRMPFGLSAKHLTQKHNPNTIKIDCSITPIGFFSF